jgi:phenylalanyl-tRNA synthetase beta chain
LRIWDIEVPVHLFVVLLDRVSEAAATRAPVVVPSRFPPVRRDLAFFVPERVTHSQLEAALRRAGGEWLVAVEPFDVYTGPGTPPGMKSLAYALQFQHPERTLAESEIEALQTDMSAAVARELEGRLRER